MTDKDVDDELDGLTDDEIRARTKALMVRSLLGPKFFEGFAQHPTDEELLSPAFVNEAARRWRALGQDFKLLRESKEMQGRVQRLLNCSRRNSIPNIPIGSMMRLLLKLLWVPEYFEMLRQRSTLLTDSAARQAATQLRRTVRDSPVRGLWETLSEQLDRFMAGAELTDAWATLPVQNRDTAHRTFTIYLIHEELRKHTDKPMHGAIADLATAALPTAALPKGKDVVTSEHVRNTLREWSARAKRGGLLLPSPTNPRGQNAK